jgi:hypothetical protein
VFYGKNKDSYWFCGLFWHHWWCFSSCTMMGPPSVTPFLAPLLTAWIMVPIMVHEEKHHQWYQKSPQNQ